MRFDYDITAILEELQNEKAEAIAKLEAWKKVEIRKRKDGGEYCLLANAVKNAKLTKGHVYDSKDLTVYFHTEKGGYQNDSVGAFVWCYTLPEDDFRHAMCGVVDADADDLRKAIQDRIEHLEWFIAELDVDMESAIDAYQNWITAITKAENELQNSVSKHLFYKIAYATHFTHEGR